MSNAITTQDTATATAPLSGWLTKAGTAKSAFTETAALSAPMAVRKARAVASDLDKLANGQYRPFIRQVLALATVKELAHIRQTVSLSAVATAKLLIMGSNPLSLMSESLDTPDKPVALSFASAVVGMWANAKGQKAAHASVAGAWLASMRDAAECIASAQETRTVDAPVKEFIEVF